MAVLSCILTDTVRRLQNLVIVLKAFLIFNLADNLDLLALIFGEQLAKVADIAALANKGGRDKVDLVLDAKVDNVCGIDNKEKCFE